MADYFPLLSRAVSALPDSTPEARRAVYDRARNALLGQLRTIQPPMEESAILAESDSLDEAIARIEREAAPEQSAPPPAIFAPAAPPAPVSPPAPVFAKPDFADSALPAARTPLRPIQPMPPVRPGPPSLMTPLPDAKAADDLDAGAQGSAPQGFESATASAQPGARPAPPERFTAPDEDDDGQPAVTIRAPGLRPDAAGMRDNARPAAPVAPQSAGLDRRVIWAGLALLIFAGVGALAFSLRVPQEDFARPRPQAADRDSTKIGQRAGEAGQPAAPSSQAPGQPQTAPQPASQAASPAAPASQNPASPAQRAAQPAPASPAAPASQRAALLVQASVNDQQNITTHVGSALWRLTPSQRPGANGQPAIRADVDLPEIRMRLQLTIEKNADSTLRASHTMTIRFASDPSGNFPAVAELGTPQMRNEGTPAVDPLAGVQAKITDNIFIIALTGEPAFAARNIETMKTRGWFDFPLRMADGRIAKVTVEKGALGDRLFEDAFEAWK